MCCTPMIPQCQAILSEYLKSGHYKKALREKRAESTQQKLYSRSENYTLIKMKIAVYLLVAAFLSLQLCLAVPLGNSAANRTCSCKKRSQEFLASLFNSANSNINCFNLQMLSTTHPANGNGKNVSATVQTSFSILSGHTNCLPQLQLNGECFNFARINQTADIPLCISAQEIRNAGHGMFPQFELHIACSGCREDDRQCLETHNGCYYRENTLSYRPLVRQQRCDQDGYEVWTPAGTQLRRQFNTACSCIRNT